MSLLNPNPAADPSPTAPPAPPAPPANPDPAANPGGEDGGGGDDSPVRPDWLPETAWKDGAVDMAGLETAFGAAGKAQDLPASADAYVMPAIDGFDGDKAKDSPLFKALRSSAFAAGVGQAAFDSTVTAYVAEMTADATASEAAERAALGENADARVKALSTWLTSSLPAEEAAALMGTATTAKSVIALEKLMNARVVAAPPAPPPPPPATKTREEIQTLMKKPEYYDAKKRDPAVVKEVEDWYRAQDATKK